MKKLRRVMQLIFWVVFFAGIKVGMKDKNLASVIISGIAVVILAVMEIKKEK